MEWLRICILSECASTSDLALSLTGFIKSLTLSRLLTLGKWLYYAVSKFPYRCKGDTWNCVIALL